MTSLQGRRIVTVWFISLKNTWTNQSKATRFTHKSHPHALSVKWRTQWRKRGGGGGGGQHYGQWMEAFYFFLFYYFIFAFIYGLQLYVLYSTAIVFSSIKIVLALNPNIPELYVIKNLQTHKSWRYVDKIADTCKWFTSVSLWSNCFAQKFYNCVLYIFAFVLYICVGVCERESPYWKEKL